MKEATEFNFKEYLLSFLVFSILYIMVDFFFHGLIFDDYFFTSLGEITGVRSEFLFLPMIIGMLWIAGVISFILDLLKPQNLQFAVIISTILGSMFIGPYHLVNYAFFTDYTLHFVIFDSIISIAEFSIIGILWFLITNRFVYQSI